MTSRIPPREHRRLGFAAAALCVLLAVVDGFAYDRARAQTVAAAEQAPERSALVVVVYMTSVTGTIAGVGDDVSAGAPAVGIVSVDRRIYLVGDEGVGRQLEDLIGKTVTVAAEVKHDADGWPYLAVEWFRVLEG